MNVRVFTTLILLSIYILLPCALLRDFYLTTALWCEEYNFLWSWIFTYSSSLGAGEMKHSVIFLHRWGLAHQPISCMAYVMGGGEGLCPPQYEYIYISQPSRLFLYYPRGEMSLWGKSLRKIKVALSTEAKFIIALSAVCKEVVWLKQLLSDMQQIACGSMRIYE